MDETYIHSSHTTPCSWSDDSIAGLFSPISKGQQFIINLLYMPVESKVSFRMPTYVTNLARRQAIIIVPRILPIMKNGYGKNLSLTFH
ncbi:hypothetical protein C0J52_06272 [Blattella germanica]|nr:hypothetical protein C0J52_06272 [Blattella germanica]